MRKGPPARRVAPLVAPLLVALLLLGACAKPDNAPGPGGVSVGEARALDDAAAMIESDAPPTVKLDAAAATSRAPDRAPRPAASPIG